MGGVYRYLLEVSWSEARCYCQKTREGCGCPKFLAGKVFRQISTLLENYSPIFRQHEMPSLPRFGHFPATKMAAGKSAPPSGTLLDFLLRDRHSLLEFFWYSPGKDSFDMRNSTGPKFCLPSAQARCQVSLILWVASSALLGIRSSSATSRQRAPLNSGKPWPVAEQKAHKGSENWRILAREKLGT